MNNIDYDFSEDQIIEKIKEYIDSTYSTHYAGNHAAKAWDRKGILLEASESNIWKYIERFGMKEGHNPKDILKIIHYCIFMLYALENRNKSSAKKTYADGEEESIPADYMKIETTIAPPGVGVVERSVYNAQNEQEQIDRLNRSIKMMIKPNIDNQEKLY